MKWAKKITHLFDIEAATVDTIYGTRGRIKSTCLLLACSGQILYHDRFNILLWMFYNIFEYLGVSVSFSRGADMITMPIFYNQSPLDLHKYSR